MLISQFISKRLRIKKLTINNLCNCYEVIVRVMLVKVIID
jgi:hypothetical protein